MILTMQDEVVGALCAWRENRGGGVQGMQSVLNVLINRATHRHTSVYEEAVRKWQFSSMTAPGDANLILYPSAIDSQWAEALALAAQAAVGQLDDLTSGSTLYYNPNAIQSDSTITLPTGETIKLPKGWNASAMTFVTKIAGHYFFTES